MTILTNILIVEEEHLRAITARRVPNAADMKVSDMIFYGIGGSYKFAAYMNLIVVTDRHTNTMRVVKNRWIDLEREWTHVGVHPLERLTDLIDWVKDFEMKYSLKDWMDVQSDDN